MSTRFGIKGVSDHYRDFSRMNSYTLLRSVSASVTDESTLLGAIGAIDRVEQDAAADALYETGVFQGAQVLLSLCCVGAKTSQDISKRFPCVPQILWPQIASFIFQRFKHYADQKLSHPQWDQTGQLLWRLSVDNSSVEGFSTAVQDGIEAD
jgi:hypothetical protein